MKLPVITRKTIKEHIEHIKKEKKSKTFKSWSNKLLKKFMEENPELTEIIIPTLESKKPDEYKKGYLAGITTLYELLRKQANKP
ncbi:hypothetical protein HYT23_01545 [Candidatus Pacearchaeota archaeon]|nr:hypothetical protein [Candidatus Pacearchaeota archaeon]